MAFGRHRRLPIFEAGRRQMILSAGHHGAPPGENSRDGAIFAGGRDGLRQQSLAVIHATRPLQSHERTAFLTALEALFADRSDVGDGELGRTLRDLQRKHFRPPG